MAARDAIACTMWHGNCYSKRRETSYEEKHKRETQEKKKKEKKRVAQERNCCIM